MTERENVDEIRETKRQYYREYRAKNRERIKQNNARYWARKAEEMRRQRAETGSAESTM